MKLLLVMRLSNVVPRWLGYQIVTVLLGSLEIILGILGDLWRRDECFFSTSACLYPQTLSLGILGHECKTGCYPGLGKLAGNWKLALGTLNMGRGFHFFICSWTGRLGRKSPRNRTFQQELNP